MAAYEAAKPATESQTPAAQEQAPVADAVESAAPAASSAESASAEPAESGDGTSDVTETSSTPSADPDSVAQTGEQGDGKPRTRAQERIEELVFERNAARKFNDHLLETIKELKGGKTPAVTETPAAVTDTVSSDDEPPTIDQYDFDPVKFTKAQSKWLKDQVAKGVSQALSQERNAQSIHEAQAQFRAREVEAKKSYPDFEEVTVKNPTFPKFAPRVTEMIVRSELGPDIAYEIGKDAVLSARIEKMGVDEQIAQIGRIQGRIEARKAATATTAAPPAKKTVTKAPPPPTPVRGGSNPSKAYSEMNMDEFVAHERAQKTALRSQVREARRAMR